jgi:small subunit ribosomal protein S9
MAPCSSNIRTALSRGPLPRAPYKSQLTCLCGQRTRSIARNLSSTARRREPEAQPTAQKDIKAATPFDFTDASGTTVPLLRRVRIVPDSPAYFSGRPNFTDRALAVDQLYHTYSSLPRVDKPKKMLWSTFADLKASLGGEPVKHSRYLRLARQLDSLHAIEPALQPAEVARALASFRRAHQPGDAAPRARAPDRWGRALGLGKRKASTAQAYLVPGAGEALVNGRPLAEAFARLHDRESALWALRCARRTHAYNVFALVGGGGVTGQAEALTLAVARALLVHEPELRERLEKGASSACGCGSVADVATAGCLYRDPRVVERKKPGHLKARKMPAWVKR